MCEEKSMVQELVMLILTMGFFASFATFFSLVAVLHFTSFWQQPGSLISLGFPLQINVLLDL